MNSTTSQVEIGARYYLPFWVLLEFLDVTPPDPFVLVEVLSIEPKFGTTPNGPTEIPCCNLMCDGKKQLVAHNIPIEFLIAPEDLRKWANDIADWFREFGGRDENSCSNS